MDQSDAIKENSYEKFLKIIISSQNANCLQNTFIGNVANVISVHQNWHSQHDIRNITGDDFNELAWPSNAKLTWICKIYLFI